MTCDITCSFASSHGIKVPLHQIYSLALMAIEALLAVVLDCSGCQSLSCELREAAGPLPRRRGVGAKTVGHRGLSLTGNYNRARYSLCAQHFHAIRDTYRKKSCLPLTTRWCSLAPG